MAEVVNLSTGKVRDAEEENKLIVDMLQSLLEEAKLGRINNIIAYIETKDGFHQSRFVWEGCLKALGMAELLKVDILKEIHKHNGDLTSTS